MSGTSLWFIDVPETHLCLHSDCSWTSAITLLLLKFDWFKYWHERQRKAHLKFGMLFFHLVFFDSEMVHEGMSQTQPDGAAWSLIHTLAAADSLLPSQEFLAGQNRKKENLSKKKGPVMNSSYTVSRLHRWARAGLNCSLTFAAEYTLTVGRLFKGLGVVQPPRSVFSLTEVWWLRSRLF